MGYTREQYKSGQHALTTAQVRKLLLSFSDIQNKALIALAIATGLRRDDLVNIKRNDFFIVDTERQIATITYYEKKKKRTRTVFIPSQETIQLLVMHLKTCPSKGNNWLFPSPVKAGAHISSRQAYNILNKQLEFIGLETRPFHSLRATCYKLCQARGWSPRKSAELLGDTLAVAEIHYNAPSVQEMQDLAQEKPLF